MKMKENDVKASQDTIFLATIIDRLGLIYAWATGTERPSQIVPDLLGEAHRQQEQSKNDKIETYDTPEDFIKARYGEG